MFIVYLLKEYKKNKQKRHKPKCRKGLKMANKNLLKSLKEEILKGVKISGHTSYPEGDENSIWPIHGHLGFSDENFVGHYIYPTESGFVVSVFNRDEFKEESRGDSFAVEINLTAKEKETCFLASEAWDHDSSQWQAGFIDYESEEEEKHHIFSQFWQEVFCQSYEYGEEGSGDWHFVYATNF
jgi:hypothetical protein